MKKVILATLVGTVLSAPAFAVEYGMAGCGLGNLVFKKENQILAATTNGTSASQFFGITTGTSNCVDNGQTAMNRLAPFVETNRVALANDAARGAGDTVDNLSHFLGCGDSAKVGEALQGNYSNVFPSQSAEAAAISRSIVNVLRSDETLAKDCRFLVSMN